MGAAGRQAPSGIRCSVRFVRLPTWANLALTSMRRAQRLRTRVRVGQASRRRIRAGGPLAVGRLSATVEAWREIRAQVVARAQWAYRACQVRTRLEVHHVVNRAQGGSDFDLDRLVALCPACHAQTDTPYARDRLVITPLGAGRFTVELTRGAHK